MEEIFKPIEGRPLYFVSNFGRVMSMKRKEPTILSIQQDKSGYAEVEVFNKSKLTFISVAREVLAAFEGYPAEPWLCVVRHKNGDLMDCRLSNLEWVICETDASYDPEKSHRKGVLKPKFIKDKMTDAKYKQSEDTIRKAVISRKNTIELRNLKKKLNNMPAILDMGSNSFEEIASIHKIQNRLNGK